MLITEKISSNIGNLLQLRAIIMKHIRNLTVFTGQKVIAFASNK